MQYEPITLMLPAISLSFLMTVWIGYNAVGKFSLRYFSIVGIGAGAVGFILTAVAHFFLTDDIDFVESFSGLVVWIFPAVIFSIFVSGVVFGKPGDQSTTIIASIMVLTIGGVLIGWEQYSAGQARQAIELEQLRRETDAARREADTARREAEASRLATEAARREADAQAEEASRISQAEVDRQATIQRNRSECAHLAIGRTFWMGFWKQNGRVVYVDQDGGRVGIQHNGGTEEFYCYQIER